MPALGIDKLFGTQMTARWTGGQVKLSRNGEAEVNACALTDDSDVQLDRLSDGRWVLTYLDSAGAVGRKYADNEVSYA